MHTIKHLKPGDEGFAEMARLVTPLHRIRKGLSQQSTIYIDADRDNSEASRKRRKETVDK